MRRHSLKARWIGRRDPVGRLVRLARLVWQRGKVGDGEGYSVKLSLALRPRLVEWRREADGWLGTLAGIRVHYRRSYGGIHV